MQSYLVVSVLLIAIYGAYMVALIKSIAIICHTMICGPALKIAMIQKALKVSFPMVYFYGEVCGICMPKQSLTVVRDNYKVRIDLL